MPRRSSAGIRILISVSLARGGSLPAIWAAILPDMRAQRAGRRYIADSADKAAAGSDMVSADSDTAAADSGTVSADSDTAAVGSDTGVAGWGWRAARSVPGGERSAAYPHADDSDRTPRAWQNRHGNYCDAENEGWWRAGRERGPQRLAGRDAGPPRRSRPPDAFFPRSRSSSQIVLPTVSQHLKNQSPLGLLERDSIWSST